MLNLRTLSVHLYRGKHTATQGWSFTIICAETVALAQPHEVEVLLADHFQLRAAANIAEITMRQDFEEPNRKTNET